MYSLLILPLAFDVFTVASTEDKIISHTSTEITPNYSFANCPLPDILVVPGGNINLIKDDPKMGEWIKTFLITINL